MAASTMVVAPIILLFFIGQHYFIEGITLTGIKAETRREFHIL